MAQTSEQNTGTGNTAVPHEGDHDRVQMLSLRADGTPDQHNPELIGDRETTLAATRRQFREQAVSAVDVETRHDVSGPPAETQEVPQDPRIAAVQEKTQAASDAADAAAESAVDSLLSDDRKDAAAGRNTAARVPAGERAPVDKGAQK